MTDRNRYLFRENTGFHKIGFGQTRRIDFPENLTAQVAVMNNYKMPKTRIFSRKLAELQQCFRVLLVCSTEYIMHFALLALFTFFNSMLFIVS